MLVTLSACLLLVYVDHLIHLLSYWCMLITLSTCLLLVYVGHLTHLFVTDVC